MTMTAPLPFADPIISSSSSNTIITMTVVDDRRNNGVCVNNSNYDNIIMNTIGNGNFFSSAAETETLVKQPAHPANDGNDNNGTCADGDDTAKNTSSDDDDDDHDDDDFEIVSLEEERPQAIQTVTRISPMEDGREEKPREGQESRSASSNVREKHSVVVDDDDDCREELTRFFLRETHASLQPPSTNQRPLPNSISNSILQPQPLPQPSNMIASPSSPITTTNTNNDTPPSSHTHRLRPLLLQVPPHTPLLLDVATTFPVIAHIHPSSPLKDHVSLGDVLVHIDGKNSVQWSFEALTRRLNSDAFGADGVERKKKKKKKKGKEEGSGNANNEEAAEEEQQDDEAAEGYRTLIVLPKEQFRQRPRRRRSKRRRNTADASSGEETESDSIVVVTPAATDRRPRSRDGGASVISPCIATPTTTATTTATFTPTTTSISAAPITALTAITTTNDVTLDDVDDEIEHPHGKDPTTTVAERTNVVVVVVPPPLPSAATDDNVTADDGNETHSETKAASATIIVEKNSTATMEHREPISEEAEVESMRNSTELSNPMAVTEVDGDGEEGVRDDDEEEEEEEVDIIDEEVREDVGIPTTGPPPATDKTAKPEQHSQQRPNEKKEEEEREYENLRRLVLRLQSQTSSLSPHQRRIYEESYELLKERDRELRRNRPPVDIDVIAIRRRGDTCVSLRISGREDGNGEGEEKVTQVDGKEDEDEEFSVEEVSTVYGGKWNPAMYSASPRRLEDVLGYDVEEGYGYGGIHHHLYRNDNHYLTLAEGDAHDMAPIPPSHHIQSKHHRLDIAHPNILGLLHPAIHRYRFDADARNALLKEQDDQVRRSALESLKRQQKRVEGFFVSLMFASVGALIVILVMVFWAKD